MNLSVFHVVKVRLSGQRDGGDQWSLEERKGTPQPSSPPSREEEGGRELF